MSDPIRLRCKCGHTGIMNLDGEGVFTCNVCKGKGRVAEPWPGSNAYPHTPEQVNVYPGQYHGYNDPSWWEDDNG